MIVLIGCGNAVRRDDGAGPAVIARLRPRLAAQSDVRCVDAATDGMAVLYQARGADELLLIDASCSGQPAGTVCELPGSAFEERREPPRDAHALRWDDALNIGRRICAEGMPDRITVFLIEAADTGFGLELSPPVAAAVERLSERLLRRLTAPEKA